MAIIGAHSLVYTSEPDAVRAVFRDAFGWKSVDAGEGWLIFALPPAEVGVHPTEGPATHELTLMCDDIHATVAELQAKGLDVATETQDRGWGITTTITLPGELTLMLYEPTHKTAI